MNRQGIRNLLFTLLLATFAILAPGQQRKYSFRHLGVENGLSQGSIYNMYKDSRGFMWLGTDDGINRFDGKNNEVYLSGSTGQSTNVLGIAEDSASDIWIGSHRGFFKYIRKYNRFVRPALKHSLGNVSVHAFADSNKNIYLLSELGLYKLKNNRIILVTKEFTYNRSQYNNFIAETDNGDFWLIDTEKGLKRFSFLTKKTSYFFSDKRQNIFGLPQAFTCAKADRNGKLWLASKTALIRFDYKLNKQTTFNLSFLQHIPTGIAFDKNGLLWLATEGSGIFILDVKQQKWVQHIKREQDVASSLAFNEIGNIYIDGNNDVFINTDPRGLDILTLIPSAFQFYTYGKNPAFNLCDYSVKGLEENQDSTIWIGTELGGLNLLNPKTGRIRHYTTKDGLPTNTIRYIFKDSESRIWISTIGGFSLFMPRQKRFKPIKLPVQCEVTTILSLDSNNLLLPSDKGLMLFNTSEQRVTLHSFTSFVMGYGAYWDQATQTAYISNRYRGVKTFRISNNKIELNSTILDGFHVLQLYRPPGSPFLWACTDRGLVKWNIFGNKMVKNYRLADGLHHEYLYCMLHDKSGRFWISTNRGITRFDPDTEHFEFINEIPPREYNSRSALLTKNGHLFFGSTAGLDLIKPELLTLPKDKVGVYLTGINYEQEKSLDSAYIGEKKLIQLPYSSNTFTLKFTAIDYRSAGLNQFRYLLEGYDKDTVYAGNIDQVRYAMLPPGKYHFHLQTSDLAGNWVSAVRKLDIIILPPFWQTWWFITLCLTFLVVVACMSIRKFITSQLRAQKTKSDKEIYLEKERSRIAGDINDSMGSEFFGLKLLGEVVISQSNIEFSNNQLQKIMAISKSISEKISEVIWLTDSNQDSVAGLWNYLQKNAVTYLKPLGILYSFQAPQGTSGLMLSAEKRHEVLNFSKQLFLEITQSASPDLVEITFQTKSHQITITIQNANFRFEGELITFLLKLKGSFRETENRTLTIDIPVNN